MQARIPIRLVLPSPLDYDIAMLANRFVERAISNPWASLVKYSCGRRSLRTYSAVECGRGKHGIVRHLNIEHHEHREAQADRRGVRMRLATVEVISRKSPWGFSSEAGLDFDPE